jgi:TPR repeat protein
MDFIKHTKRISLFFAVIALAASFAIPAYANDVASSAKAFSRGDYKLAIPQLRSMASQGNANAQYLLAHAYEFGKGVEQSPILAITWYSRANHNYQNEGVNVATKHCRDLILRISQKNMGMMTE